MKCIALSLAASPHKIIMMLEDCSYELRLSELKLSEDTL